MGNNKSSAGGRLEGVTDRAAQRVGKVAVSGRFKKLPKRLEDDYEVDTKVLGTGYNGSVFLAKSKTTGKKFAVKGFHLHGVGADKMKQLQDEAEIFLGMDHPHVARLVDVYESETHLNLVMECMEGGELFERLSKRKRFSENDAANAGWQMLLAVNYIHNRGIVHRDLKLENFLYEREDSDHLKLIDFGFSHIWEPNTKMALSCGTLAYVAPEVLKKSYTSQCDLWSFGVILFILLAGYMPFSGSEQNQRRAIEGGKYSWRHERWVNVSAEAIQLVKALLDTNPTLRPTAEQALQHRWLLDNKDKGRDSAKGEVDQEAINALADFAKASKFRRACMSVMAWSLTNEERSKVREIFMSMDENKKGTITLKELKKVLTEDFKIADEDAQGIFLALDTAQNEEIHYSEFLAAMVSTRIAMHDDLMKDTFSRFDVDNSGYITVENLREVLGESFNGAEVEKLLQEADLTKDGRISYAEFLEYLKGDGANASALEAADKIIDTELKKPGAQKRSLIIGTLAWAKDTGVGAATAAGNAAAHAGATALHATGHAASTVGSSVLGVGASAASVVTGQSRKQDDKSASTSSNPTSPVPTAVGSEDAKTTKKSRACTLL